MLKTRNQKLRTCYFEGLVTLDEYFGLLDKFEKDIEGEDTIFLTEEYQEAMQWLREETENNAIEIELNY